MNVAYGLTVALVVLLSAGLQICSTPFFAGPVAREVLTAPPLPVARAELPTLLRVEDTVEYKTIKGTRHVVKVTSTRDADAFVGIARDEQQYKVSYETIAQIRVRRANESQFGRWRAVEKPEQ